MKLVNLKTVNFRNLSNIEFFPCEGMNVICGENGEGKTNLIEAIWLFSGAKSFRKAKDNEFIKFNEQKALISSDYIFAGTESTAKIEIADKKIAYLNDNKIKSASILSESFKAVIFSPAELSLITDGPGIRRRFIDIAIGQLYPGYIEILRNYKRAVVQRNSAIKEYRFDSTLEILLDSFEDEIAKNGEKIIAYRKRYIEILKEFLPLIYDGISSKKETLNIEYSSGCDKKKLHELLKEKRKDDSFTGVTSVGPHRDDIEFYLNGISARSYGSQGQKRSISLSLKLSEAEVIKKITGEYPICLLDDVMSELDKYRQNYVLNHIKGMQSILSCCDPSNTEGLKSGKLFIMKNGELKN